MSYPGEREYQLEYPTDDQPPFRLADMAPKRQRPGWVIPLACMLAVAVAASAAGAWAYSVRASTKTPPLTAASASPSTSPTTSLAPDPVTINVCARAHAASSSKDAYDPDKMESLGTAAKGSDDTSVRLDGQMLISRAELARASKGQSDEVQHSFALAEAVADFATYCIRQGYVKP